MKNLSISTFERPLTSEPAQESSNENTIGWNTVVSKSVKPASYIITPEMNASSASNYLPLIYPRTFIPVGTLMPGTDGLVMKPGKTVFNTLNMPSHILHDNFIKSKKIVLDYSGLVHLANNPVRVSAIKNHFMNSENQYLQNWILSSLKSMLNPDTKNWALQYDNRTEQEGYHFTRFWPNAFKAELSEFTPIADRIILKNYGKQENTLHVQTGFLINRDRIERDDKRLELLLGRTYTNRLSDIQKAASSADTEIISEKFEELSLKDTPSVEPEKLTLGQSFVHMQSEKSAHLLGSIDDLKDQIQNAYGTVQDFLCMELTEPAVSKLQTAQYPLAPLINFAIILSKKNCPVISLDTPDSAKTAGSLAVLLLSNEMQAEFCKTIKVFKQIQSELFILECKIEDLSLNITSDYSAKNDITKAYSGVSDDFRELHESFNQIFLPCIVGIGLFIEKRSTHFQNTLHKYSAALNMDREKLQSLDQQADDKQALYAFNGPAGLLALNSTSKEIIGEQIKTVQQQINVLQFFIQDIQLYSRNWLNHNNDKSTLYINTLASLKKMFENEIKLLQFGYENKNFIDSIYLEKTNGDTLMKKVTDTDMTLNKILTLFTKNKFTLADRFHKRLQEYYNLYEERKNYYQNPTSQGLISNPHKMLQLSNILDTLILDLKTELTKNLINARRSATI